MEIEQNFQSVDAKELHGWITSGEELVLIHTLPPEDYAQRRLPGAVNACVYEMTFLTQIQDHGITPDAKIVVYGSSARSMDAVTAAAKLMRAGYEKTVVLSGGMDAWHAAGFALEGDGLSEAEDPVAGLTPPDGTYGIDTAASVVEWTGRNPNGKHFGTLRLAGGQLQVVDGSIKGQFEIDMTSIRNTDLAGDESQPTLIEHLRSDDFFFVERFAKAYFLLHAASLLDSAGSRQPNYRVKGSLELRGIRLPLEFNSTLSPLGDSHFAAQAHFDFDRTQWGVVYGSRRFFERLGMHLVFDVISLELRLVFKPSTPPTS